MHSLRSFAFAGLTSATLTLSLSTPAHLFDPLIPTKIAATYALQPSVPSRYPEYTSRDNGTWQFFGLPTWTDGFFPATLYALNERAALCPDLALDGNSWLQMGRSSATGELPLLTFNLSSLDHDVGFLSYPFAAELRVNPDNQTALTAVKTLGYDLSTRFSPIVGCTRSWNTPDPTNFQVIIDNMMNLEILFQIADLEGNETYRDMAISHADKTRQNHIRPDGSTYHVVEYNSTTGAVVWRGTSQGYSDSSTWSRGQSWGIYGFANAFANTGLVRFLDTARFLATYWLANTPSSGIIPWDFNAPQTPFIADTSAAMIAANGFLLLAQQEEVIGNKSGAAFYQNVAVNLVNAHSTAFWSPSWQSLLSNGTVNAPALNNLTGIVYGDYYFIRAGNEMVKQGLVSC